VKDYTEEAVYRASMQTTVRFLAIILLVFLVISCPLEERDFFIQTTGDDIELPDDDVGALIIDFSAGFKSAKTLVPPVDMDVHHYDIVGTLEGGGDGFTAAVGAGESFSQYGLTPGQWTIIVDAINPGDITIGEGATTALITAGSTTSVQITIAPLTGNGTLDLRIEYDKKLPVLNKDEIVTTVTPAIAGSNTLSFRKNTQANLRFWTYTESQVPEGYYFISLQLVFNGKAVWGIAEAVRILEAQITSASYFYTP